MNNKKLSVLSQCSFFTHPLCLFVCILLSANAYGFFGKKAVWDIDGAESQPLLLQVNKKVVNDKKWFKKSNYPRPIHEQLILQPLPPELAYYLAKNTSGISFVNDPVLTLYLQSIVDKLLGGWKGPAVPVTVLVEANPYNNVRVDQHNQILISTGFLLTADSEDYLATLLAHELGHILLKHNQGKAVYAQKLPELIETFGLLALVNEQVKGAGDGAIDHSGQKKIKKHKLSTQWILSDLMSPFWSRISEQEADYLALDMVQAAGYNIEAGYQAFAGLDQAEMALGERLAALKDVLLAKLTLKEKMKQAHLNEELQSDVSSFVSDNVGLGKTLDKLFSKMAQLRAQHINAEARQENASLYTQKFYDDVPLVKLRKRALARMQASATLRAISATIKASNYLLEEDIGLAEKNISSGFQKGSIFYWFVRHKIRQSQNNDGKALESLRLATKNPLAHGAMYLQLADYQLSRKQLAAADNTLRLGIQRLGEQTAFYPSLIKLAYLGGDKQQATALYNACLKAVDKYKIRGVLTLASKYFNKISFTEDIRLPSEQACLLAWNEEGDKTQGVVSIPTPDNEKRSLANRGINKVSAMKDAFWNKIKNP